MGHVRENRGGGTEATRGVLNLGPGEKGVVGGAQNQNRDRGIPPPGERIESQHIDQDSLGLALKQRFILCQFGVRHPVREQGAADIGNVNHPWPERRQHAELMDKKRIAAQHTDGPIPHAVGGRRRHQYRSPGLGGGGAQVALYHQPAHRMADQQGLAADAVDGLGQVLDVIRHAQPRQQRPALATAMAAQTDRVSGVAPVGKVGQKINIPDARVSVCAVDE